MSQAGRYFSNSGPGGFIQTLTGDVGGAVSPTAGNINILGGHDINTVGNPGTSTITVNVNNAITLGDLAVIPAGSSALTATTGDVTVTAGNINMPNTTALGAAGVINFGGNRFIHKFGTNNTFIGENAGNFTLTVVSATTNNALGDSALLALTTGDSNTAMGNAGLLSLTTGDNNSVFGANGLFTLTTGRINDGLGANVGTNGFTGVTTGSFNILIGGGDIGTPPTGSTYTGAESSNILIQNVGVNGESNTLRIGNTGAGDQQVNRCFIAGIASVDVGSVASVVSIASGTGQLGLTTITAGTGVSVTPGANTITIAATGTTNLTYTPVNTTPYVVLTTDEYLGVDSSGGIRTIQLPNAPATGRVFIVKDSTGSAAGNAITVTTVGGVVLIDAAASFVMNTAYESIQVIFNGTKYEVF